MAISTGPGHFARGYVCWPGIWNQSFTVVIICHCLLRVCVARKSTHDWSIKASVLPTELYSQSPTVHFYIYFLSLQYGLWIVKISLNLLTLGNFQSDCFGPLLEKGSNYTFYFYANVHIEWIQSSKRHMCGFSISWHLLAAIPIGNLQELFWILKLKTQRTKQVCWHLHYGGSSAPLCMSMVCFSLFSLYFP